jgi:hypothetical protein
VRRIAILSPSLVLSDSAALPWFMEISSKLWLPMSAKGSCWETSAYVLQSFSVSSVFLILALNTGSVFTSRMSFGRKLVIMLPKSSMWITSPTSVPCFWMTRANVGASILLILGPNSAGLLPFARRAAAGAKRLCREKCWKRWAA